MTGIRSKRASARRTVLAHIRDVKRVAALLTDWWDVRGKVYVLRADREPGENAFERPRAQDEYPEAQRHYWASTVREIENMQAALAAFHAFATAEFYKCEEGGE